MTQSLAAQAVVVELDCWARRAEADIGLLEALLNRNLAPGESVASALPKAVLHDHRGSVILNRCSALHALCPLLIPGVFAHSINQA